MKVVAIACFVLAGLIASLFAIGALLPQKHVAIREITLRRPPDEVYGAVRDFASAATWRPDLKRIVILEPVEGRPRFREEWSHGAINYEVVEDVEPRRLVTNILDRDLGYFGTWTYEFEPVENDATRVRITENGEVPNVMFRFISRFVFGHTKTMETYLRALGRKFGEEVTPR